MTNTLLEAAIQGIGDGARLEQLAADLLRREGYQVEPTGTRGPDGGRDSLLYREDEIGILHCSISSGLESKLKKDAKKAADREEDFNFFVFATTQNPAGVKRDRLETEIGEEYNWQVKILDFERIRNRLMGDQENHDLAKEHLSVDPGHAYKDVEKQLKEKLESSLDRLSQHEAWYGTLESGTPMLTVHIFPIESLTGNTDRIDSDLVKPPTFTYRHSGYSQNFGDAVITTHSTGFDEEPYRHYTCFHTEGWVEAATTRIESSLEENAIQSTIDELVVDFVEKALSCFDEVGIRPPFYVYISILGAEDRTIAPPKRVWGPDNQRKFGTDRYTPNRVQLNSYESDVPTELRRSLFQIWRRAGWSESIHYEQDEDTGDYIWSPYER